jgi:Protein of unknown function (DUF4240)
MNEFWDVVERARADAVEGGVVWPSGSAIGAAVVERLTPLPLEQIVEFHLCFTRVVRRAHQWKVCAAAFVIWGHISDDGFSDFKAGLVTLGRDTFERVVLDADTLADIPLIQAAAAGQADRFVLAAETIYYAASRAYERRSGDAEAFWDALDSLPMQDEEDQARAIEPWSGRFGSPEDAAQIPAGLPRLHELFAAKATGSR